jgi:hypothetical protein
MSDDDDFNAFLNGSNDDSPIKTKAKSSGRQSNKGGVRGSQASARSSASSMNYGQDFLHGGGGGGGGGGGDTYGGGDYGGGGGGGYGDTESYGY